jgi:malate dehydrogenase
LFIDLFNTNADVIADLISGVAKCCPKAFICIITNPVNSTVPIAVEVLKKKGVFDPSRIFGVTTLDVVRASTFTAHALGKPDPQDFKIPVVGGHSGATILPLISQSQPPVQLTQEQIDAVTFHRMSLPLKGQVVLIKKCAGVQFGGDEIVKAKAGAGSATTCMAYAGFQ